MMARTVKLYLYLSLTALLLSACQPMALTKLPAATPQPTTPSFMRTACLYQIPPDEDVECGFLLTREVHNDPTSRIIRLHVVIFKSASAQPRAEPLVILNGGPGSADAPVVGSLLYSDMGLAWRTSHDVILIDQRGTNFSIPSLQCAPASSDPATTLPTFAMQTQLEYANLQSCYSDLVAREINLSAYHLMESAADIHDLRVALGYDQIILYGYSYGSLLAMSIMRDYPADVHSAILDSVLPLGIDLTCERLSCLQSGLDALFAACAADAPCHAAYPSLEADFWTTIDRLRTDPVPMALTFAGQDYTVVVDDQLIIRYVFLLLQQSAIRQLPAAIEAVARGYYVDLARSWISYVASPEPSIKRGEKSAEGLYFSTMCSYLDTFAADSPSNTSADENAMPAAEFHPALVEYGGAAFAPCAFWDVAPLDVSFIAPLPASDIPTLVLAGKFDPGLAPYLSHALLPNLRQNSYYELPVSHGVVFAPCGLYLTYAFLQDATQPPDTACIEGMAVEWVLPE
ncbi:MAG: alpha/beta fold hydrolase [Caldilineaceae bacterium]